MAQVQNQYTGDGSTVLFSFTFPYIETSDIKVSLDGVETTEYSLANATTVEFNVAPADGAVVLIRRQTNADETKAVFFPGSAIRAQDLNDNFEQSLFVAQETTQDSTDAAASAAAAQSSATAAAASAAQATIDAAAAVTTANQASNDVASAVGDAANAVIAAQNAEASASAADTKADAAVATANNAETVATGIENKADQAIATANTATITANNAEGVATTAETTSIAANNTANTALTIANNIDGKATFAIATAENAEDIAQNALDAVSGDSPWIGSSTAVYLSDTTKNVGIGEASAPRPLWVNRPSSTGETNTAFLGSGAPGFGTGLNISSSHTAGNVTLAATGDSAKNLIFKTGSNERMRLLTDGSLGIGTSGPASKLEVASHAQHRISVKSTDTTMTTGSDYGGIRFASSHASNPRAMNWDIYQVAGSTGGNTNLEIDSHGKSGIVKILSGGNIGLNWDAPTRPLVVNRGDSNSWVSVRSSDTGRAGILLGDQTADNMAQLAYDNSSEALQFVVGGSERMRITSTSGSRLGIGTSAPKRMLHVNNTTTHAFGTLTSANDSIAGILFGDQDDDARGQIYYNNSTDVMSFIVSNTSPAEVNISSNDGGRLGVGTDSPNAKLEVVNSAASLVEVARFRSEGFSNNPLLKISADEANAKMRVSTSGSAAADLTLGAGNVDHVMIKKTSGDVGIGANSPASRLQIGDGTVNSSSYLTFGRRTASAQTNPPVIGQHSDGTANDLALCATSGTGSIRLFTGNGVGGFGSGSNEERVRVDSQGNVGIGLTSPGQKLDVNGNLRVRGNLIVDGSGGGGGGSSADFGYVNVKEVGATGDGSTDDTVAIRTALQAGGAVYFPDGTYRVTSTITVTNKGLHMYGDGQASRILFDPSTSGDDFLDLRYNDGTPTPSQAYAISNLVIQAKQNKVCGYGVRLYFTGAATLVGVANKLTLTNVDIGSQFASDANTGYFKTGLKMLNSAGVVGTNLNIYTNAKTKVEYGVTDSIGIDIQNNLAGHAMIRTLYLNNFYIQRYHTGIRAYSSAGTSYNSLESLYLSQGELLAAKAIKAQRMSAITVIGIHSDVRDYFLDTSNGYGDIHYASTIRILGNDIRANRVDSEDTTTQDYLFNILGQQTIITGNNIMSFKNTQGIFKVGGSPGNQINTVISGNHLSGNNSSTFKALRCESNARQVTFGGNTLEQFGGNLSPISNSSGTQLSIYGQRAGNTV